MLAAAIQVGVRVVGVRVQRENTLFGANRKCSVKVREIAESQKKRKKQSLAKEGKTSEDNL